MRNYMVIPRIHSGEYIYNYTERDSKSIRISDINYEIILADPNKWRGFVFLVNWEDIDCHKNNELVRAVLPLIKRWKHYNIAIIVVASKDTPDLASGLLAINKYIRLYLDGAYRENES